MRRSTAIKVIAASIFAPNVAFSQAKKRPLKFIVGYAPGGATDLCARLYATRLQSILKRDIIVENRPGGNTLIANRLLSNSPATSGTYLIGPMSSTIFREIMQPEGKRGYSMFTNYTSVATLTTYPMGLMVSSKLGIETVQEFAKWIKDHPNEPNFGTASLGSHSHLLAVMLSDVLEKKITPIPYMGNNQVVTALMSGQIDAAVVSATEIVANLNNKRVKVIGTFTEKRSSLTPNVPTFSEHGVNALGGEAWMGMWAHAEAPHADILEMQNALSQLSQSSDFQKELFDKLSVSQFFKNSQDMRLIEKSDFKMWDRLIKKSNLKIDI